MKNIDKFVLMSLSFINPERAYGFGILKHINTGTGNSYSLGNIYVALKRLEDSGFIVGQTTTQVFPERGDRPKRYYSLTEEGRDEIK